MVQLLQEITTPAASLPQPSKHPPISTVSTSEGLTLELLSLTNAWPALGTGIGSSEIFTQVVNGLEQKSPALADRIVVAASVGLANRAKRKAMSIVMGDDAANVGLANRAKWKAMSIVMGDDTSSVLKGGARELGALLRRRAFCQILEMA